jgi:hypothetical protein
MKNEDKLNTLDLLERPVEVDKAIDLIFDNLKHDVKSKWSVNGSEKYNICTINDHKLVKYLIDTKSTQKEFYFVELGAGAFTWGDGLSNFLNTNYRNTPDYKFHIISVNAENDPTIIDENERCITYKYGNFKLENILSEVLNKDLDLLNKVDFIISHFTFRHLVDPVETFWQVYSSLLKNDGLMAIDGFTYTRKDPEGRIIYDTDNLRTSNLSLSYLLTDLEAKFITHHYSLMRSYDHFIIQKGKVKELPLVYSYTQSSLKMFHSDSCYSGRIEFISTSDKKVKLYPADYFSCKWNEDLESIEDLFLGDEELFVELKDHKLLGEDAVHGNIEFIE